jgi:hypothetical protein
MRGIVMPNGKSSNLVQKVPTYIPLADVAKKYGITEEALTQLIEAGKIEAVQLSSGELLVAADNGHYKSKKEIIAEEFSHLRGSTVSASEASRKYSDDQVTIYPSRFSDWANAGYITSELDGYRLLLDESEVAYCAKVYREKFNEAQYVFQGVARNKASKELEVLPYKTV